MLILFFFANLFFSRGFLTFRMYVFDDFPYFSIVFMDSSDGSSSSMTPTIHGTAILSLGGDRMVRVARCRQGFELLLSL